MRQIAQNLWIHDTVMKLFGTRLPLRMSLVKQDDGNVWVHAPIPLNRELKHAVDAIGPIKHIVAANNGHHLSLVAWQRAFPRATVFVTDRIPKKCPRLSNPMLLRRVAMPPWQKEIHQLHLEGAPLFDERIFLHRDSRSLMVTDVIQNYSGIKRRGIDWLVNKLVNERLGFKGLCIAPPLKLKRVVKDRDAYRRSLDQLWQWEFERIIPAHGPIIEGNAKQKVRPLFERFYR